MFAISLTVSVCWKKLKEADVNLKASKMKRLTFSIFIVVLCLFGVQGFDLKCHFHQTSYTYVGHVQTCIVSGLSIKERNKTVTSINLETGEMMFDDQSGTYLKSTIVKALTIDSETVMFMPKGIEKFFPNLEYLRIAHSQLAEIEESDIKPFPNLKELQLYGNQLFVLKDNLFQSNPNIQHLQFDSNPQLKYVGENIFSPLVNLERAYFQSCGCISTYADQQYNIPNLKSSLKINCPNLEKVKNTVCGDDFQDFKEKISFLEEKISAMEKENSLLKSKMKAMYTSCDGNLDATTRSLHLASKKLESCEVSTRFDESEMRNVNLTCMEIEKSKCEVTGEFKVMFADTSLENISTISLHEPSSVKSLIIKDQQTIFLPENIAKHFPALTELSVTSSGLFQISTKVFKHMKTLETLTLPHNKIIEISTETFDELENLLKLDLSFNNIEGLRNGVFSSLKNLELLKLNNNKMVSINVYVFKPLLSLQDLSLARNFLKFISANLLSPLKKVINVDLSNNECIDMSHPSKSLAQIENEIIDNCIAPIELHCSLDTDTENPETGSVCKAKNISVEYPRTKISQALVEDFQTFDRNVTIFVISGQSTQFLPYQLFKVFPNLTKIVVENSKLSSLHKHDFKGLEKLKTIEIHHNNLSFIEEAVFDDVKQLEFLDLSNNNIKSLPPKIFLSLVHIKSLTLSHNQIEKFTADLLPRKNAIEEFKVDNNELELIETKILRYLRKAKIIDLTANVCIDLKFDKNDEKTKTLIELSGEIDLNCSSDD